MLSEMLQTLSVQPLWIERTHNKAQSGYSRVVFIKQLCKWRCAWCAYVYVCYFFPKSSGAFSACSMYLFLSGCPVRLWVSLSLTCRQMNIWANMNIWIIHYSRSPRARLRICWPVSQLGWERLGIPAEVLWSEVWVNGPRKLSLEDTPATSD